MMMMMTTTTTTMMLMMMMLMMMMMMVVVVMLMNNDADGHGPRVLPLGMRVMLHNMAESAARPPSQAADSSRPLTSGWLAEPGLRLNPTHDSSSPRLGMATTSPSPLLCGEDGGDGVRSFVVWGRSRQGMGSSRG